MEKAKIRLSAVIALIISVLTGLIVTFFCLPKSAVFAEETADGDSKYTTVTEDLENVNGGFDTSKYPLKEGDYSLSVLAVAVNKSNELLVYVYQPAASGDYLATSINIDTDGKGAYNYELELISSDTVFFKYKVKDLEFVYSKFEQEIEIPSIYRAYIKGVDDTSKTEYNGNNIVEIVYPVAKKFVLKDGVTVQTKDVEVIKITDKYVGTLEYMNGTDIGFLNGTCKIVDSFFCAFSCDHDIDKLYHARVSYIEQEYESTRKAFKTEYERTIKNTTKKTVQLSYDKVHENEESGKFYFTYSFKEIQTVDEFLKGEDKVDNVEYMFLDFNFDRLSDSAVDEIKKKDFVLRFANYDSTVHVTPTAKTVIKGKFASAVTILSLDFETDGVRFNLNCVDNKNTPANSGGGLTIDLTPKAKLSIAAVITVLVTILAVYLAVKTVLEHGLPISRKDSVNIVVKNGNVEKNNKERKNGNKKK